jgi:hypothetical protein
MGYSRKEEIAKLRRERKEAKAAKKRKENIREKLVRFLIVCEGTKTEPHYFKALINNFISAVREVTIEGEGRATVALVDRTQEIKAELERKNAMTFDRVWVVFDKDDYIFVKDIRKAITEKIDEVKAYVIGDDVKEITLRLGALTDHEREIIEKGCLINYNRK